LTKLPTLPDKLEFLSCNDNQLISLPNLPKHLLSIVCSLNQLSLLPNLPDQLEVFECDYNPIHSIIGDDINEARAKLVKINKFRDLYYLLKFKDRFRKLLWERVRLPRIEAHYHPDNLINMLQEDTNIDTDIDNVLNQWIQE
jgi:hypothetical protein